MHRETASAILRDRGRESWEIRVLVAFLDECRVLQALPEDAEVEDLDEAARIVVSRGQLPPNEIDQVLETVRSERLAGQRNHRLELIETLAIGQDEFTREEIADRVEQLTVAEAQIARVGIPQELVVPLAGFLQAADCNISATDSPEQVRTAIHYAAKRLLQASPL